MVAFVSMALVLVAGTKFGQAVHDWLFGLILKTCHHASPYWRCTKLFTTSPSQMQCSRKNNLSNSERPSIEGWLCQRSGFAPCLCHGKRHRGVFGHSAGGLRENAHHQHAEHMCLGSWMMWEREGGGVACAIIEGWDYLSRGRGFCLHLLVDLKWSKSNRGRWFMLNWTWSALWCFDTAISRWPGDRIEKIREEKFLYANWDHLIHQYKNDLCGWTSYFGLIFTW